MKDRFAASDYRFLAVCTALAAVAAWYSVNNFFRAFPEASIDIQVSREGGRAIAQTFLYGGGYRTEAYRSASSFTYDDTAKTFLERTQGLETANRIMGGRVRLWRWSYRWFRPRQKEEFRVEVSTRGELVGFEHDLPEDAARPTATFENARSLAETFLRDRMHRDLSKLDFVEESAVTLEHRTDRTYTWKERDFNPGDATNRVEVKVSGDEVTACREYLKVPEQWTRDYRRLRSSNEVASRADVAVMAILIVGLVVVIVNRLRRHDIRWRRAATVGMIGMALSFCAHLNEMPLQEFDYPTTDSYTSFMVRQLLNGLLNALAAGGLVFVLAAGAEPLYREAYGRQVSLGSLFSIRGLRTKRFFLGSVLGITLTAIFVAYQTAFYIAAYRYGAWSPADVPYSDILNTRFPWAYVLFGGFLPAVSEEFLFRMFAIPFLRKLARSTLAALILAGFIWGFGHAGYPQQPFYIRGVEVGIGGVALGMVMLRWGILPTLVWHYSVDAMYSAMLLLRSQSLYLRLSGAASAGIIVLPVAVALIAYWRKGGFEPVAGLLNADESPGPEPPPDTVPAIPPRIAAWQPLSARTRVAAAAILVIGLLMLRIPLAHIGDRPHYTLGPEQALAATDSVLRSRGIEPAQFRHITWPGTHWDDDAQDSLAAKYFLERKPVAYVADLFERNRPVQYWLTRYFKPLDAEQILVGVHPETGTLLGYDHTLPEDRPGADLPEAAALAIATPEVAPDARREPRPGLGNAAPVAATPPLQLKESKSEKKQARRDYIFEWAASPGDPRNVDETVFRVQVEVDGDRPVSLRSHWKVPESFERTRERKNFLSILVATLRLALIAGALVACIFLLLGRIRAGHLRWGPILRIAAAAALLSGAGNLLSTHLALRHYQTEMPLETFQTNLYLGVAQSVVFGFLVLAGASALLVGLFPGCFAALRGPSRRLFGLDAAVALAAAVGLGLAYQQAETLLQNRFHAQALFDMDSPDLIAAHAPALAALAGALRTMLLWSAAIAAVALILPRVPRRWRIPLAILTPCIALPLDIRTPAEFALHYVLAALALATAAVLAYRFARDNYLAYALILWAMALRGPISELLGTGHAGLQAQGWAIVVVMLTGIVWAVLPALGRAPAVAGEAGP